LNFAKDHVAVRLTHNRFADTDVDKMRTTMTRSRDTLKVSAAMFRWSIGDARADASMGIGYAGLIAALERLNPAKASSLPSLHPPPSTELPPTPPLKSHHTDSLLPAHARMERPSINEQRHHQSDEAHSYHREMHHHNHHEDPNLSRGIVELHKNWRAPSVHSSGSGTHSTRDTVFNSQSGHGGRYDAVYEDVTSIESPRSRMFLDEKMSEMSVHDKYLHDSHHQQSRNDSPMQSVISGNWQPRQPNASKPAGGKAALVTAVEQRKHSVLEQLLEGGARVSCLRNSAVGLG
jgi:hypothetical protein